MKVNVNGKKVSVKQKPGSYIAVTRQWKDGDRIEANYPMSLQLEKMCIRDRSKTIGSTVSVLRLNFINPISVPTHKFTESVSAIEKTVLPEN